MKEVVKIFALFLLLTRSLIGANPSQWFVSNVPATSTSITQQSDGKLRLQTTVANGNASHKLPALAQGTYQLQFTASIVTAVLPKIAVYNLAGVLVTEQLLTAGINSITFNSDGGAGIVKIYEAALNLNSTTVIDIDNYTLNAVQVLEEKATDKEKTSERVLATKEFELSNHLGNVLTVVSDKKLGVANAANTTIDYYKADVQSANDYYAFGSMMNGRKYTGGGYRYGFNGKEMDDEVKGQGNQIVYEARIYDSRLCRWLSIDPFTGKFPELSPYQNSENNPIYFMDNDGREPNRSQAANWTQIKAVLVNYFKNPDNQSLHRLRYTEGSGGGGGQVGPFGGEKGPRYIFTEKYGWVDLGHFFQVASEIDNRAQEYGSTGKWLIQRSAIMYGVALVNLKSETEKVENGQPEGSDTKWSYEDPASNLAGMDFWFFAYDTDENIIQKLEAFFTEAGAKDPKDAPNYEIMQDVPQKTRWFEQNKKMTPVKNPEPTKDNKKAKPKSKNVVTEEKKTFQPVGLTEKL